MDYYRPIMRDRDVRLALNQMLSAEHYGDPNTSIVHEMGVWSGSARIDVAVINGSLSGYELKSDSDTLARLPLQVELYGKVFDRLTLVVGARHAVGVERLLPAWWGLLVATQSSNGIIFLKELRRGKDNPSRDPYLVAQLLWKDEAIAVLERYGLARGWRGKKIRAIHERIAREFPIDVIARHVRDALRGRKEWLRQMPPHQLDMAVYANPNPML